MEKIELSIVVPMYNEQDNVSETHRKIHEAIDPLNIKWELIFVNDGSIDNTLSVVSEVAEKDPVLKIVSYLPNRGRGYALRQGFNAANGEYILSIDFDLSYDADHLVRMYQYLKEHPEADVVLGSAYMKGGEVIGVPKFRLFISKLGNLMLRLAFPWHIHTITCVLRGYRKEAIKSLALVADGKEIHLEILSKVLDLGYKVAEIPATLTARRKGTSKFKFKKTSLTHLAFLFFEKPIVVFGIFGTFLLFGGILTGLFITYLRFTGKLNPGRPLTFLTIILIVAGIQLLSFGLIAILLREQRREIYRLQQNQNKLSNYLINKN
ncbi:MAG: glycosyltransferase family 2 protein [Chlamydiae bacterium]|nr:MAG: glycosyltransferase family 2 protein [Chlamydiota bacterium]